MSTDYGAWPLASLRRDWRRITASIGTLRGGWRATWRHAREFAASRRIVVHSLSPSDGGPQLVLRTRVRLNGDVQTDVLASWLRSTPDATVQALTAAHFREVAAATASWPALAALARLGSKLLVVVTVAMWAVSAIQHGASGWRMLAVSLLADWRVWFGLVTATVGVTLRVALRLWLRCHFRCGLA